MQITTPRRDIFLGIKNTDTADYALWFAIIVDLTLRDYLAGYKLFPSKFGNLGLAY